MRTRESLPPTPARDRGASRGANPASFRSKGFCSSDPRYRRERGGRKSNTNAPDELPALHASPESKSGRNPCIVSFERILLIGPEVSSRKGRPEVEYKRSGRTPGPTCFAG